METVKRKEPFQVAFYGFPYTGKARLIRRGKYDPLSSVYAHVHAVKLAVRGILHCASRRDVLYHMQVQDVAGSY